MKLRLAKCLLGLALAAISLPSQSALLGRDLDVSAAGFEAYYDTVLGITWLGDANYAQTSGHDSDGRMTWNNAVDWANNLDVYGYDDWRLPTMVDTGTPGCNNANSGTDCGYNVQTTDLAVGSPATVVYSEMASLFYDTLGNQAEIDSSGNPQTPNGLQETDPFSNIQSNAYWSGLENEAYTAGSWVFDMGIGRQIGYPKNFEGNAWAVRSGDVSAVPLPASVWLLGSSLAGLVSFRRFRR